ncbi:MAG: hypothetical protein HDR74_06820 [Bacteroides sp.]|nr:hypothetical protein [Bacteroides sp.]
MKQKQVRSEQLRAMFGSLADEIANRADKVLLTLNGNSISIDLSGAVINISVTEPKKGGEK